MWFDLLVVCILIVATIRGAMKGVVWQLAVIASLLFCFCFAGSLSTTLAPSIHVEPPLNRWIAMFALYVGFSFVAFGAARVLREMMEKIRFQEYDRHLGAVLGLLKGVVFALFVAFFLVTLSQGARQSIMNSQSGYAAAIIMDRLHPVMPDELHALLEPYIHQLDRPDMDLHHNDHDGASQMADTADPDSPFEDSEGYDSPTTIVTPAMNDSFDSNDPFSDAAPDRSNAPRRLPAETDQRSRTAASQSAPRPAAQDGRRVSDRREQAGSDGDWLAGLPATLDREARDLAVKAWRNTRPEHRAELTRRVATGIPEIIRDTLRQWQNGKPQDSDRPTPDVASAASRPTRPVRREEMGDDEPLAPQRRELPAKGSAADRAKLEQEIASIMVDDEEHQQAAISEMDRSLRGVPDSIALAVLVDWRSDLLAESPDPDPQTTARTSLGDRIARHRSTAGGRSRSLDTATPDRSQRTLVR